jgi:DNA repair photolyase
MAPSYSIDRHRCDSPMRRRPHAAATPNRCKCRILYGMPRPTTRGRGAAIDPSSRFTQREVVWDGDELDYEEATGEGAPDRTRVLRDASRSVLSHNDAPDIPFDVSLNPYRGCEHGCSYCLAPETRITLADGSARPLRNVEVGDRVLGTIPGARYRRLVATDVRDVWRTVRRAYRVKLTDGTVLVASGDHRFLTQRGWKHVTGTQRGRRRRPHLTQRDVVLGIGGHGALAERPAALADHDHQRDDLTGTVRGDGTIATYDFEGTALKRSGDVIRVAQIDDLGHDMELVDLTTGTGDFLAEGIVSHNCYARPTHEYLGLSAGLDFERILFAKPDAPDLLAAELARPSWVPQHLALSGVTDPYQPIERRLGITRGCLEVLAAHRQPVGVITKNALVTRDLDLLAELARYGAARVSVSLTTLDEDLRRRLEPRTSTAAARLGALRALADAGVPVGVVVAPVIPGLNDHEIPAILAAAADHGAQGAAWTLLRLPGAVEAIFVDWLRAQAPLRAERVLSRLREARGGRLNDARFGHRMRGEGAYVEHLRRVFEVHRRRAGLERTWPPLATEHFRVPGRVSQGRLF